MVRPNDVVVVRFHFVCSCLSIDVNKNMTTFSKTELLYVAQALCPQEDILTGEWTSKQLRDKILEKALVVDSVPSVVDQGPLLRKHEALEKIANAFPLTGVVRQIGKYTFVELPKEWTRESNLLKQLISYIYRPPRLRSRSRVFDAGNWYTPVYETKGLGVHIAVRDPLPVNAHVTFRLQHWIVEPVTKCMEPEIVNCLPVNLYGIAVEIQISDRPPIPGKIFVCVYGTEL